MGIFDKLFAPKKPDDYYLISSIASLIDGFISTQGLKDFLAGGLEIQLSNDYRFALSRLGIREGIRATVSLDALPELAEFKAVKIDRFMADGILGHAATDQLAKAIFRKMKPQIEAGQ